MPPKHRTALKATALNPTEKLRQVCAERVAQKKKQLLQQLREQGEDLSSEQTLAKFNNLLSLEFDNIMKEECIALNISPSNWQEAKIMLMSEIEAELAKEGNYKLQN